MKLLHIFIFSTILFAFFNCGPSGDPNQKMITYTLRDSIYREMEMDVPFQLNNFRVYPFHSILTNPAGTWGKQLPRFLKDQIFRYARQQNYIIDTIEVLGRRMFICESDMLISENNIINFLVQRLRMPIQDTLKNAPKPDINKIIVVQNADTKKYVHWPTMSIKYCIDSSFTPAQKDLLVIRLKKSGADWKKRLDQSFCPIFQNVSDLNGRSYESIVRNHQADVDFVVTKGVSKSTQLYASAFFPDTDRFKDKLFVIGDLFFSQSAPMQEGTCRHEMGHILGLLHEHISVSGCPAEIENRDMYRFGCTDGVDFFSVMHYRCGRKDSEFMTISDCDSTGVNAFYRYVKSAKASDTQPQKVEDIKVLN